MVRSLTDDEVKGLHTHATEYALLARATKREFEAKDGLGASKSVGR